MIAFSHNDILVSCAGWKQGRITFIISPILCQVCTFLSYEIFEMAILDGCPITLDDFDPMYLLPSRVFCG